MRVAALILLSILVSGCNSELVEELAFRKTLEYNLVELCGEDAKECIDAVKTQIKQCMESSDWRKFLKNQDDTEELNRFTRVFYACIVDEDGKPYFQSNL